MMSPIKTIISGLKVSTDIMTSISDHHIGLAVIQVIMTVSAFKTVVILYISSRLQGGLESEQIFAPDPIQDYLRFARIVIVLLQFTILLTCICTVELLNFNYCKLFIKKQLISQSINQSRNCLQYRVFNNKKHKLTDLIVIE